MSKSARIFCTRTFEVLTLQVLTSSEFASVLATSATTGAEAESVGNSWIFSHLVEAFSTQWSDAALAARDAKARKSEAVVAAVDNLDLSGLIRGRFSH